MATYLKEGEYVSASEAAEILGITMKRMSQLNKEGRLPFIAVGHHYVLPLDAVLARRDWLAARHEAFARKRALREAAEANGEG